MKINNSEFHGRANDWFSEIRFALFNADAQILPIKYDPIIWSLTFYTMLTKSRNVRWLAVCIYHFLQRKNGIFARYPAKRWTNFVNSSVGIACIILCITAILASEPIPSYIAVSSTLSC